MGESYVLGGKVLQLQLKDVDADRDLAGGLQRAGVLRKQQASQGKRNSQPSLKSVEQNN